MVFAGKFIEQQALPNLHFGGRKGSRAVPVALIQAFKRVGSLDSIADTIQHSEQAWTRYAQKQSHSHEAAKEHDDTVQFMRSIIESQQTELIAINESKKDLEGELESFKKKTASLKDVVEEFSMALAASREEAKDLSRRCQTLELENRRLQRQAQVQAFGSAIQSSSFMAEPLGCEREMRALATQLATATDDVTKRIIEVKDLNENIEALSSDARVMAKRNELLSQKNEELQKRLAELTAEDDGLQDDTTDSSDDESIEELKKLIVKKGTAKPGLTQLKARRIPSGVDQESTYETIFC
ncbi:hypothetical protein JX265_001430 [Neoarthrinium moseri]|uniref:Uncharacterized protein n=1 Tax=Neoarthrinium moseri TaxID=1658444 RepID=A0A9Q0AQP5_9PEZI|nr:hypothetical protein JX265_001430 [Neoarthrinium moseri]